MKGRGGVERGGEGRRGEGAKRMIVDGVKRGGGKGGEKRKERVTEDEIMGQGA